MTARLVVVDGRDPLAELDAVRSAGDVPLVIVCTPHPVGTIGVAAASIGGGMGVALVVEVVR